jgi:RNA polymerase sigma-70 factor (ECF subfamily)
MAGVELFERHYKSISRFFANKVGAGADDLIQNTFLACVEGKERFREDSSFRTYLFGIARNLLHQSYKVNRRNAARFDPASSTSADLSPGAGTMMAKREEERLLLVALRHLPLELQEVLELYYWESQRAPRIAECLDMPEGTVRTRLRRAKKLLQAKLEELASSAQELERTQSGLEDWAMGLRERAPEAK